MAVALGGALLAFPGSSGADVSEVRGSAYGYRVFNFRLFGGAQPDTGPTPTVTLPSAGGNQTASAPSGRAQYGPAVVFESGPIAVSTQGTTGTTGAVTSSSTLEDVGPGPFTAGTASSTCTANESGTTGSTTLTNGELVTSQGNPQVEGDETVVPLPANPAPNTVYEGSIETVGDTYRAVFNEQVVGPDGTLTVNAAHLYLLGPTAQGDLIIGQSVCDVTVTQATTTTTEAPTSSTTVPETTTTTMGTTTTTVRETTTTTMGTTTTTVPETTTTTMDTTTTTQPTTTTTTAPPPAGPTCQGEAATIVGTSGDDFLQGTAGRDVILGRGGDDFIVGYGGDDVICGGSGKDRLVGGSGNDQVLGGTGSDHLIGGMGEDQLDGGSGPDQLNGGSENDSVFGGNGTDDLNGAAGDDQVDGGAGDDACKGGGGSDNLANCEG